LDIIDINMKNQINSIIYNYKQQVKKIWKKVNVQYVKKYSQ
jgi:hypothetical protein